MATDERRTSVRRPGGPTDRPADAEASRRDDWSTFWSDPFVNFWRGGPRRVAEDLDRWFQSARIREPRGGGPAERADWTPDIETHQRDDQFVMRADLPGLKRADIVVHATDGALTIEGERRAEEHDRREGYYRTERSYGRFCRTIPLPEGAIPDSAKATFKDGVLEVVMNAPPREVSRGRRIEIAEPDTRTEPEPPASSTIYPE